MRTRKFAAGELEDWGLPYNWKIILSADVEELKRWTSVHSLIFTAPDDGKTYQIFYEMGLTENQDSEEMFADPTEGVEVYQQEKIELAWVPLP